MATVLVPGGRFDTKRVHSRLWQSLGISGLQIGFLAVGTGLILPAHPVHPLSYWATIAGVGLVWWSLIRFLVEKLGDAGRITGIVLLVVQLAGSGGTYPVILSPKFFQIIHPYLPMTWAIHVFRWSLSNGYPYVVTKDALYLASLGVAALVLTRWWPKQWLFEAPVAADEAQEVSYTLPGPEVSSPS